MLSTAFRRRVVRSMLVLVLAAVLLLFLAHEALEEPISAAAITCVALALITLRALGRGSRPDQLAPAQRLRQAARLPAYGIPFVRLRLVPLRL